MACVACREEEVTYRLHIVVAQQFAPMVESARNRLAFEIAGVADFIPLERGLHEVLGHDMAHLFRREHIEMPFV